MHIRKMTARHLVFKSNKIKPVKKLVLVFTVHVANFYIKIQIISNYLIGRDVSASSMLASLVPCKEMSSRHWITTSFSTPLYCNTDHVPCNTDFELKLQHKSTPLKSSVPQSSLSAQQLVFLINSRLRLRESEKIYWCSIHISSACNSKRLSFYLFP